MKKATETMPAINVEFRLLWAPTSPDAIHYGAVAVLSMLTTKYSPRSTKSPTSLTH